MIRAFVRLREMLLTNADLARKLADLERKDDSQFKAVFDPSASLWNRLANPIAKLGTHRQKMNPEPRISTSGFRT